MADNKINQNPLNIQKGTNPIAPKVAPEGKISSNLVPLQASSIDLLAEGRKGNLQQTPDNRTV